MNYKVVITSEFAKEAKRIAKKHANIKNDIAKLIADLTIDPFLGTESEGARAITILENAWTLALYIQNGKRIIYCI